MSDYQSLAQDFRKCLYDSMRLAMAAQKIDYIPGCVELGDFDSTSTTIALFPCDELEAAPEPALRNTFNQYWQFFKARASPGSEWDAYTPYEIRHVGAFVRLGEPDKAHALLNWFHQYQRPQAWNHWAEVVWHDPKTPKFIGDMPHTWVGSDFLNSGLLDLRLRAAPDSLVVFAGVPREWVDSGEPIAFQNLVTPRGKLSGSLQRQGHTVKVTLQGDLQLPPGGILVRHPPTSTDPGRDRTLPPHRTDVHPSPPHPRLPAPNHKKNDNSHRFFTPIHSSFLCPSPFLSFPLLSISCPSVSIRGKTSHDPLTHIPQVLHLGRRRILLPDRRRATREGGRGESILGTPSSRKPSAIWNNQTGDTACDHYHRSLEGRRPHQSRSAARAYRPQHRLAPASCPWASAPSTPKAWTSTAALSTPSSPPASRPTSPSSTGTSRKPSTSVAAGSTAKAPTGSPSTPPSSWTASPTASPTG